MQAFGVYERRKVAKRAYVIIDKEGVIRYINIRPSNNEKGSALLTRKSWSPKSKK